jgi:murein DD-endopeptidase MepM/ murein hydrolase activator NlpD
MHKDDKFYTFQSINFNKIKNYVSQERVSNRIFQSSVAGFVLIAGVMAIGFSGIIKTDLLTTAKSFNSNNPALISQQTISAQPGRQAEYKSFNYSRPDASENFAENSGGPFSELTEGEADETSIETQLRMIESTSNPAFLPTMWSHLGKINNEFGYRRNPFGGRNYEFHAGMDISGDHGDLVAAPANGVVIKADWEGGYGNMIEVNHGNGLTTRYGHLSKIGVQIGDTVQRGQLMGLIGSTGRSTGPHLHYEVRLNDKPINPRRFLPPEPAAIKALRAE